jgi:magnesium transporter
MMTSTSLQPQFSAPISGSRLRTVAPGNSDDEDQGNHWDEQAPLLSSSIFQRAETFAGYGSQDGPRVSGPASRRDSSRSSSKRKGYNVNYPPSVPGTPKLRPSDRLDMSFGDIMMRDDLEAGQRSPRGHDGGSGSLGSGFQPQLERRHTVVLDAETDVCFPQSGMSDIVEDEHDAVRDATTDRTRARRRRGKWPDLAILDEWSQFEKEGRSEERRAKKITEPQLINGRLRPVHRGWFQAEEEAPYRFTYFNEEFQSTIHSQTISELVQPGGTFKELFIPDPPLLSDSSDDEDELEDPLTSLHQVLASQNGDPHIPTRQPSLVTTTQSYFDGRMETSQPSSGEFAPSSATPRRDVGDRTPRESRSLDPLKSPQTLKVSKPPRYGDRPVWWLDMLSPTEAEMKVISKAFGIHPLTAEDIMVQEQREKVELFRHYYFVNYRTFDQDQSSENFLEPVNMYVVVFREGVLSFHFSMTPHPANVRRRIRQLRDYMILSSDWISYAIIDDITDVFGPLIQNIEDEVDDIDDAILRLHSPDSNADRDERSDSGDTSSAEAGRDMLRRVGDCRKRVMSLYRLLGNKADVIKGFAKRCNEHWEVAPRSEIGLYLGDIQDHIVTMTSNLSHYEKWVLPPEMGDGVILC